MSTTPKPGFFATNKLFLIKGMTFTFVAVMAVLLWDIPKLHELLDTYYRKNQEIEQIENMQNKIKMLKRQQASLQQNGFEVERQVRERFNWHRPGEKVINLRSDSSVKSVPASGASDTQDAGTTASRSSTESERSRPVKKKTSRK